MAGHDRATNLLLVYAYRAGSRSPIALEIDLFSAQQLLSDISLEKEVPSLALWINGNLQIVSISQQTGELIAQSPAERRTIFLGQHLFSLQNMDQSFFQLNSLLMVANATYAHVFEVAQEEADDFLQKRFGFWLTNKTSSIEVDAAYGLCFYIAQRSQLLVRDLANSGLVVAAISIEHPGAQFLLNASSHRIYILEVSPSDSQSFILVYDYSQDPAAPSLEKNLTLAQLVGLRGAGGFSSAHNWLYVITQEEIRILEALTDQVSGTRDLSPLAVIPLSGHCPAQALVDFVADPLSNLSFVLCRRQVQVFKLERRIGSLAAPCDCAGSRLYLQEAYLIAQCPEQINIYRREDLSLATWIKQSASDYYKELLLVKGYLFASSKSSFNVYFINQSHGTGEPTVSSKFIISEIYYPKLVYLNQTAAGHFHFVVQGFNKLSSVVFPAFQEEENPGSNNCLE